jgi:hypothetical protein
LEAAEEVAQVGAARGFEEEDGDLAAEVDAGEVVVAGDRGGAVDSGDLVGLGGVADEDGGGADGARSAESDRRGFARRDL